MRTVIVYISLDVILSFVYESTATKLVTLSVQYKIRINVLTEKLMVAQLFKRQLPAFYRRRRSRFHKSNTQVPYRSKTYELHA